jgi:hypothetical protein
VVAHLFRHRGCDPEGADKVVFDAEKQSLAWVARLGGNNGPRPPGIVDSTPVVNEAAAVVVTRPSRGW